MKEQQIPPNGDRRYRVHRSVKCYVARLGCGTDWCTWDFTSSAERVVYVENNGNEVVYFKTTLHRLHTPEEMIELVTGHLADKGIVSIAGRYLAHYASDTTFTPYHYIDVTSRDERSKYERLRPLWLGSKAFRDA